MISYLSLCFMLFEVRSQEIFCNECHFLSVTSLVLPIIRASSWLWTFSSFRSQITVSQKSEDSKYMKNRHMLKTHESNLIFESQNHTLRGILDALVMLQLFISTMVHAHRCWTDKGILNFPYSQQNLQVCFLMTGILMTTFLYNTVCITVNQLSFLCDLFFANLKVIRESLSQWNQYLPQFLHNWIERYSHTTFNSWNSISPEIKRKMV